MSEWVWREVLVSGSEVAHLEVDREHHAMEGVCHGGIEGVHAAATRAQTQRALELNGAFCGVRVEVGGVTEGQGGARLGPEDRGVYRGMEVRT